MNNFPPEVTRQDIIDFFKESLWDCEPQLRYKGKKLVAVCPFCRDKGKRYPKQCLKINPDNGLWACDHLYSCGMQGNLWTFAELLGVEVPEKFRWKKKKRDPLLYPTKEELEEEREQQKKRIINNIRQELEGKLKKYKR
jgi:hypothetical protein